MIGPTLHLQIDRMEWRRLWPTLEADCERLVKALNDWLDLSMDTGKTISVVFGDDDQVRALNHQFRGKDKPTNVLSFPNDEGDELGDVILALEVVMHEAREQGKEFVAHATHLVLHGLLHILGYDHIEDDEAEEMESLEVSILAQLSIANPYE